MVPIDQKQGCRSHVQQIRTLEGGKSITSNWQVVIELQLQIGPSPREAHRVPFVIVHVLSGKQDLKNDERVQDVAETTGYGWREMGECICRQECSWVADLYGKRRVIVAYRESYRENYI